MESNTRDTEVQKYFNWKIVLAFFSTLTLLALIFLIRLRGYFTSYVNSELFDKYYNVFVGILFLNMCLSTYTITLYYYRIQKPGMKGQQGRYGELGDPGESVSSVIYIHLRNVDLDLKKRLKQKNTKLIMKLLEILHLI